MVENSTSLASNFQVTRDTVDRTSPVISNITTNASGNKIILDKNNTSQTFEISATITDVSPGVDTSTVKISSNNGTIVGKVLIPSF